MEELFEKLYSFCLRYNAKFEFSVEKGDIRYIRICISNNAYLSTNLIDATHDSAELIAIIECILRDLERKIVYEKEN